MVGFHAWCIECNISFSSYDEWRDHLVRKLAANLNEHSFQADLLIRFGLYLPLAEEKEWFEIYKRR